MTEHPTPADLLSITLHTERLTLRPISRADTSFAVRHFTNPDVYRFMLDDEPITTAAQAEAIIDFYVATPGDTYTRWVLVRRADGAPLGTCGYHRWSRPHRMAEIGYDLSPQSFRASGSPMVVQRSPVPTRAGGGSDSSRQSHVAANRTRDPSGTRSRRAKLSLTAKEPR
ncbi:GNAT family N-acetyltransferase [Oscillochloris sp. ZM17-4]|nr:GNAT family N-acetyltransferase [Oscillochloris sp. ZM17-4]